jgi:hypothetical protein
LHSGSVNTHQKAVARTADPAEMINADPAGMIIVLLLTFFGALGAGYLPYSIKVKESQLLVVSALGGGLLIGCKSPQN